MNDYELFNNCLLIFLCLTLVYFVSDTSFFFFFLNTNPINKFVSDLLISRINIITFRTGM